MAFFFIGISMTKIQDKESISEFYKKEVLENSLDKSNMLFKMH